MQAVFQNEVLRRLRGVFLEQLIQIDFTDVQTVRHFFDGQMIADVLIDIADGPADQIMSGTDRNRPQSQNGFSLLGHTHHFDQQRTKQILNDQTGTQLRLRGFVDELLGGPGLSRVRRHVDTVAMESTGVYWIPLYELLESRSFTVLLVNARHVKNV